MLGSLEEKRVDGVVLCSSRLQDDELRSLLRRRPAVVLVNRLLEGDGVYTVLVDDRYGGRLATQHLLQAGHRAIGYLAGPPISHSGRQRGGGYREALTEAGVSGDPAWIAHCSPMVEGGATTARELLTARPQLTALFCYNDLVAVGLLSSGCSA